MSSYIHPEQPMRTGFIAGVADPRHGPCANRSPAALVCLGATAAQALFGSQIRIGRDRGRPVSSELAELTTLTAHGSSILRVREEGERDAAMQQFVADLKTVAEWLSAR